MRTCHVLLGSRGGRDGAAVRAEPSSMPHRDVESPRNLPHTRAVISHALGVIPRSIAVMKRRIRCLHNGTTHLQVLLLAEPWLSRITEVAFQGAKDATLRNPLRTRFEACNSSKCPPRPISRIFTEAGLDWISRNVSQRVLKMPSVANWKRVVSPPEDRATPSGVVTISPNGVCRMSALQASRKARVRG